MRHCPLHQWYHWSSLEREKENRKEVQQRGKSDHSTYGWTSRMQWAVRNGQEKTAVSIQLEVVQFPCDTFSSSCILLPTMLLFYSSVLSLFSHSLSSFSFYPFILSLSSQFHPTGYWLVSSILFVSLVQSVIQLSQITTYCVHRFV